MQLPDTFLRRQLRRGAYSRKPPLRIDLSRPLNHVHLLAAYLAKSNVITDGLTKVDAKGLAVAILPASQPLEEPRLYCFKGCSAQASGTCSILSLAPGDFTHAGSVTNRVIPSDKAYGRISHSLPGGKRVLILKAAPLVEWYGPLWSRHVF